MNKNKKVLSAIISLAMTATMVPMTVFAEDPPPDVVADGKGKNVSGSASVTLEGMVDENVYSAVLPTSDLTEFNFIIDPQGLINATAKSSAGASADSNGKFVSGDTTTDKYVITHDKYANAEFEAGKSMYFKSYAPANPDSSDLTEYSSTSSKIRIENRSSIGLDAKVDFVISGVDGVTFTNADFKVNSSDAVPTTEPAMYLALVSDTFLFATGTPGTLGSAESDTKQFTTVNGVTSCTFDGSLTGSNSTKYKYKYTAGSTAGTGVYSYELDADSIKGSDSILGTSDDSYKFEYFEFALTGAVNDSAKWFDLVGGDATSFNPKIDVVFDVALEGFDNATEGGTGDAGGNSNGYVMTAFDDAIVLPSTSITSVNINSLNVPASYYNLSGNNFTISTTQNFTTLLSKGNELVITFSDADPITIAISNGA